MRKFGPSRIDYLFRLGAGIVILALLIANLVTHGVPKSLIPSESILFGGIFGLFLVVHSAVKLLRRDYRG